MQIRSFRGSGEPARVIALSNARDGLGPDPRRALGPAAIRAASTGRTRDRTRPMLQKRQKVLARAPSTRDPGCVKTLRGIIAPGILGSTVMRRAKKRKNLSSARHYDQIRFRFHTAKTHKRHETRETSGKGGAFGGFIHSLLLS